MRDQLNADLKQAMLDRDELRKTTLQGIKSAIKYAEIDAGKDFEDNDIQKLMMKEAKKRRESIDLYKKGGNEASAEKETKELEIIESYLPTPPSHDELKAIVQEAIDHTGAQSMSEMGRVIGAVQAEHGDTIESGSIAQIAKELLG